MITASAKTICTLTANKNWPPHLHEPAGPMSIATGRYSSALIGTCGEEGKLDAHMPRRSWSVYDTATVEEVPVTDAMAVSVAVIVWLPVVCSVAANVPVPLVNVASAGSDADPSVLVKCVLSLKAVAVLLKGSRAVTVKLNAVPAVAVAGADTEKCVAAAGETAMVEEVPVKDAFVVSVTVMVWLPAVCSVAENVPVPLLNVASAGSDADPSELVK
jgi:hypothetical protein